jgi:hypothetical protein
MASNLFAQIILFTLLFFYLGVWKHQRCQERAILKIYYHSMMGILLEKPFKGEVWVCGKKYFLTRKEPPLLPL